MLISFEGTDKICLLPGQDSMGDDTVLSYYYLLRNVLPKPTCVLEHCRDGQTNGFFSIFPNFHKSTKEAHVQRFPSCIKSMHNIKTDLQELEFEGMDWIDLVQNRDRWQALVNAVTNLWVP